MQLLNSMMNYPFVKLVWERPQKLAYYPIFEPTPCFALTTIQPFCELTCSQAEPEVLGFLLGIVKFKHRHLKPMVMNIV